LLREAAGYCHVCGAFGCSECLTFHEGNYYCKRDFRPIQEQLERAQKREEELHRPDRQRLVVHTRDGKVMYGVCFALNLNQEGFKLDVVDKEGHPVGKTVPFQFRDLKAVFYVKSFDGHFDKHHVFQEWHPQGSGLVVVFEDGEVIKGHTYQAYRSDVPRFHLVPDDAETNNVTVLVERAFLKSVHTPEEYHALRKKEVQEFLDAHMRAGVSQEECMGDFHFERKDYSHALAYYMKAEKASGMTPVLLKKVVTSEYNIAMRHVREKHYHRALAHLERAHRLDPDNERISEKIHKLRHALGEDTPRSKVSGY